jgi:hypothetical protein
MVFCGDRKSRGRGIEEGNGGADEGEAVHYYYTSAGGPQLDSHEHGPG